MSKKKYETIELEPAVKLMMICFAIAIFGFGFILGHGRGIIKCEEAYKEKINETNEWVIWNETKQNNTGQEDTTRPENKNNTPLRFTRISLPATKPDKSSEWRKNNPRNRPQTSA